MENKNLEYQTPSVEVLLKNIDKISVYDTLYLLTLPNLFTFDYPVISNDTFVNEHHENLVKEYHFRWNSILKTLWKAPAPIDYEFVCGLSKGFQKRYSPDVIRQLLRMYHIQGYNFSTELFQGNFQQEEHYLIVNLFFKGKI